MVGIYRARNMSHETGGFMKNILILLTALFLASCATQSSSNDPTNDPTNDQKNDSKSVRNHYQVERDWAAARMER
jgi:uncharacterized lipoprotein YajG